MKMQKVFVNKKKGEKKQTKHQHQNDLKQLKHFQFIHVKNSNFSLFPAN